jgi:hypothetical protein
MTRKDKMTIKKIAYCGRRLGKGSVMFDAFVLIDESDDALLYYKAARVCRFIIGQIYNGKITEDHTIRFDSLEAIPDELAFPGRITEWSADDAVARRTKINESTRKKLQAEYRAKWLEDLEPLRNQYRRLNAGERRAMRQLVIEWIEARA